MAHSMSIDWQPPDWLTQAATVIGSLAAGGAAKPVWDWWRERGQERRASRKIEEDAATSLRNELRADLRVLRADLNERDEEIEAVRREMYELLGKVAALTAENHAIRADGHRLRNWLTVFYGDLQRRWDRAGLPRDEFPSLPPWIADTPDGPTASFRGES